MSADLRLTTGAWTAPEVFAAWLGGLLNLLHNSSLAGLTAEMQGSYAQHKHDIVPVCIRGPAVRREMSSHQVKLLIVAAP